MSARLSPQREAEIAARLEAAAPGPWTAVELPPNEESKHPAHWVKAEYEDSSGFVTSEVIADCPWRQTDAEFIAHAREDVPALLTEVERQRAELAAVRAAVRAERDEVAVEVARFGIYGTATSAAKALVARASELVDENASLRAERDEAQERVDELEAELADRNEPDVDGAGRTYESYHPQETDEGRCLDAHAFSPRDGWRMVCARCDHTKAASCHEGGAR
ncbi:hypothetical protein [Streptomyces sp. NPDC055243]|uniref:hypothetical protein n=1 Tax=Streptomyces sp. NPDC055243 TaxID=3365720 RepID=UPI0037D2F3EF